MFPSFLPNSVKQLKDSSAVNLAQKIKQSLISTPLHPQPIATAYLQQGKSKTAKPILLLHGFDSSLLEYRHLIPHLAQKNPTWAIDLLGFGFTERISGLKYQPETIRTHLHCFWKSLINQPVIIIGASMGGAVAIDFTIAHPEAVAKLILIDSIGFQGSFPLGKLLFPPLDYLAVEFWRQRKLQALFWGNFLGKLDPREIEAIRCSTLSFEMVGWDEALISFTKSGGYSHVKEFIPQISKPTLILWGEEDEMLGREDASKFRDEIAQSKLIWIEKAGHVPHYDQPEITAQHILQFC
ncbi:MAG: alpha/beta hydrolase [Oscillatoria sp. PMC 1068.18]|nr:alpha/beta hydrolase [Oscillatoria sp. PMC 1076.18]MEC4990262.1 alpha/beta hydrolase [Oscillatoria sp. PMC 1068.18]